MPIVMRRPARKLTERLYNNQTPWIIKALALTLSLSVSACSIIEKKSDNHPARLIFYNELNLINKQNFDCQYLGPIISSQGHWYDYLFISNADLVLGTTNDMHNKASQLGANIVYINSNIDFATSVTLFGQAYHCETTQ